MEADFSIWALLMSYFGENFCLNSLPLSELTWGPLGRDTATHGGCWGDTRRGHTLRPALALCDRASELWLSEAGAGGWEVGGHLRTCRLLSWLLDVRLWLSRFPHCFQPRVPPLIHHPV